MNKKARLTLGLSVFAVLGFFAFGIPEPKPTFSYAIAQDYKKPDIKRHIKVVLSSRISESLLTKLAHQLKASDTGHYKNTFIQYTLAGQNPLDGYWASTDFTPELNVAIFGLSQTELDHLLTTPNRTPTSIATWLRTSHGATYMVELYDQNQQFLIRTHYSPTNYKDEVVQTEKTAQGQRITTTQQNDFGEYYVMNKQGDLEFWSNNGRYYTAALISGLTH